MITARSKSQYARAYELELQLERAEAVRARTRTREQLLAWELGELAEVAELLVTELVANAVVHAAAPARLRLVYDGELGLEVTDGSASPPALRCAEPEDESGRGLELVEALADRWGFESRKGGKTVWCWLASGIGPAS